MRFVHTEIAVLCLSEMKKTENDDYDKWTNRYLFHKFQLIYIKKTLINESLLEKRIH